MEAVFEELRRRGEKDRKTKTDISTTKTFMKEKLQRIFFRQKERIQEARRNVDLDTSYVTFKLLLVVPLIAAAGAAVSLRQISVNLTQLHRTTLHSSLWPREFLHLVNPGLASNECLEG